MKLYDFEARLSLLAVGAAAAALLWATTVEAQTDPAPGDCTDISGGYELCVLEESFCEDQAKYDHSWGKLGQAYGLTHLTSQLTDGQRGVGVSATFAPEDDIDLKGGGQGSLFMAYDTGEVCLEATITYVGEGS